MKGDIQIGVFGPINCFISETIQYMAIITISDTRHGHNYNKQTVTVCPMIVMFGLVSSLAGVQRGKPVCWWNVS